MTNREKYEKEIIEVFWKDLMHPAVTKNGIESCDGVSCNDCLFSYRYTGRYDCDPAFRKWLTQEYKEPEIDWTKVPVDTKILVKDKKEDLWINSHFAYYKDGKPYAFFWGRSSWTVTPDTRVYPWEYTEIADPEEREKYLKYE